MYHLFAGDVYYPTGGIFDYIGTYTNREDALRMVGEIDCDWWHITDADLRMVDSGRKDH